uniref:Uncharacterized protein n=1 Tax=Oryza sativa subsp. japonica TaxID=39947 RepID=Q654Z8_ORYSJ|nr:hypothetical protein [Oryza sativa Japonica Group]
MDQILRDRTMPKREEARGGVSHLQGRHGIAGGQGHLPRGGAPHRQRAASRGGGGEDGQQGKPYDLYVCRHGR